MGVTERTSAINEWRKMVTILYRGDRGGGLEGMTAFAKDHWGIAESRSQSFLTSQCRGPFPSYVFHFFVVSWSLL